MQTTTKIITSKSGSILGKIKYAVSNPDMSSSSSSGRTDMGNSYYSTSPRDRPEMPHSSVVSEPPVLRPYRPNRSAAISSYRERASRSNSNSSSSSGESGRNRFHSSRHGSDTHGSRSNAESESSHRRREHHDEHHRHNDQREHRNREYRHREHRHREHRRREQLESDRLPEVEPQNTPERQEYHSDSFSTHELARELLKIDLRPTSPRSSNDEAYDSLVAHTSNESFFPSPLTTFLLDRPTNVMCSICLETPLQMADSSVQAPGTAPAMLACGHIACEPCMTAWVKETGCCPFCRTKHVHQGCGHKVKPRKIALDTICDIPPMLADGGHIQAHCDDCRREKRVAMIEVFARDYQRARMRTLGLGGEALVKAIDKMNTARREFEHRVRSSKAEEMAASGW
jgi:hypothetical protein